LGSNLESGDSALALEVGPRAPAEESQGEEFDVQNNSGVALIWGTHFAMDTELEQRTHIHYQVLPV
jgi:hypothetical protein